MQFSFIRPVHDARTALGFADGFGDVRQVSEVCLISDEIIPYTEQFEKCLDKASGYVKVKAFVILQAFNTEDLDSKAAGDYRRANRAGRDTVTDLFPARQAVVFSLEHKSLIWNVIVVNGVGLTGVPLAGPDVLHRRIAAGTYTASMRYVHAHWSLDIEQGDDLLSRSFKKKRDANEKLIAEGKEPVYLWEDDLRERIRNAAAVSYDWDDFEENLAADGVAMKFHKWERSDRAGAPDRYITYELKDKSNFPGEVPAVLRRRSDKLGYAYDVFGLREKFAENREEHPRPDPEPDIPSPVVHAGPVPFETAERDAEDTVHDIFAGLHPDDDFEGIWDGFRQWRADHRKDLNLASVYDKDRMTELVTVNEPELRGQFLLFDAGRLRDSAVERYDSFAAGLDAELAGLGERMPKLREIVRNDDGSLKISGRWEQMAESLE